jgi:hypothetical protein
MQNIKNIIERYLSRQTQYAILFSGSWGIGKTYYYRNYLENLIKKTNIYSDNSKKYKPVYISLFGLKSVDEIQAKIALDLFSYRVFSRWYLARFFQKRNMQLTITLSKLLINGILFFKGLDKLTDYISAASKQTKKQIDIKDIFICFDDLERRSPQLKIEEFSGYVNLLVESYAKVCIICNENKITDKEYTYYKEKIIGIPIEYNPNPAKIIDGIINTQYGGYLAFKGFLQTQKAFLIELANKTENNYRHLIYALDSFHDIYSSLKNQILDSPKDYAEKCNEEINNIAKFSLITAAEFKALNLSYKDAASMRMGILNLKLINNPNNPKNKIELLLESYFENTSDYKYYDSIFGFVTGADDFDIESFVAEFKSNYRLENGKVLPEYRLLYELDFFKALKLSDEEYNMKTLQVLEYAKNGKYLLMEYLQVYFYCERFNNPLGLDLNQLGKDLKNAMTLAAKNPEYVQKDTVSKLSLKHQNGYDDLQEEIKLHGLQILEKFRIEKEKESTARDFRIEFVRAAPKACGVGSGFESRPTQLAL